MKGPFCFCEDENAKGRGSGLCTISTNHWIPAWNTGHFSSLLIVSPFLKTVFLAPGPSEERVAMCVVDQVKVMTTSVWCLELTFLPASRKPLGDRELPSLQSQASQEVRFTYFLASSVVWAGRKGLQLRDLFMSHS